MKYGKKNRLVQRILIFTWFSILQYSCSSGNAPRAQRTDYEQFTLQPILRVNPESEAIRPPIYIRMPALQRDEKGTVHIAWTRSEDSRLMLQSKENDQEKFSEPRLVYNDEWITWDDHPTLLRDSQKNRLYLSSWRKGVMRTRSQVRRGSLTGGKANYFSLSEDGGKSWSKQIRVSSRIYGGAFEPTMAGDDAGRFYIAWSDERNRNTDVFVNRSTDNGATWLENEIRISPGEPGQGVSNFINILPGKDGNVCVIFSFAEMDKNCAIYAVSSKDSGATWGTPVRINDNPEIHMDLPKAVRRGDEIVVVWNFVANSVNSFYLDRSTDGGNTWSEDRIIYSNPKGFSLWNLEKDGKDWIHLFWMDHTSEGVTVNHMRSEDFGKVWITDEKTKGRISRGGKDLFCDALTTGSRGDVLAAVWQQRDKENGTSLMANYSRDNGKTWLSEPFPIAFSEPDRNICNLPQVLADKDSLWFLWVSISKGNRNDLFLRSLTFKN